MIFVDLSLTKTVLSEMRMFYYKLVAGISHCTDRFEFDIKLWQLSDSAAWFFHMGTKRVS